MEEILLKNKTTSEHNQSIREYINMKKGSPNTKTETNAPMEDLGANVPYEETKIIIEGIENPEDKNIM